MFFLLKRLIITLFMLIVLWGAGLVWFISLIPASPAIDGATTDAIVVLTGGSLRLEHGLSLLVEGKAPLLFVSGVEETITLPELLRGKEVAEVAPKVPQDKIELGHRAHSTLQNAEETKAWVARHPGIKSIRLVTGNYHTPRSVFVLHEAMPGVSIIAEPVFPAEFADGTWWYSQSTAYLVFSEYHKYLASRLAVMLGLFTDE